MDFSATGLINDYWGKHEIFANALIVLNIAGALMLGLLVGYERSFRGRAAGMRTYGFVCMSSCALTVMCGNPEYWYGFHSQLASVDPTRVMQGIVTGIGFLGAGVIMRDGMNISGLTTAASIWAVAAIGILVGVGFYAAAMCLSLLAALLMMWGSKIDTILPAHHAVAVTIHFRKKFMPDEEALRKALLHKGYSVARGSFSVGRREEQHEWRFVAVSHGRRKSASLVDLGNAFSDFDGIDSYNLAHARN